MLGTNHRVRNTPVRSSTTKLHRAISPSMKDQWSGKTLRRFFLPIAARPRRSSAQLPTAPILLGLEAVAAVVALLVATLLVSMISHAPRSSVQPVRRNRPAPRGSPRRRRPAPAAAVPARRD